MQKKENLYAPTPILIVCDHATRFLSAQTLQQINSLRIAPLSSSGFLATGNPSISLYDLESLTSDPVVSFPLVNQLNYPESILRWTQRECVERRV